MKCRQTDSVHDGQTSADLGFPQESPLAGDDLSLGGCMGILLLDSLLYSLLCWWPVLINLIIILLISPLTNPASLIALTTLTNQNNTQSVPQVHRGGVAWPVRGAQAAILLPHPQLLAGDGIHAARGGRCSGAGSRFAFKNALIGNHLTKPKRFKFHPSGRQKDFVK